MLRQLHSSPGGEFSAGAAAKRCAIEKTNRPRNLDWDEGCEKPFPQRGPSFLSDRSEESEATSAGQCSPSRLGGGDTARHLPSGLLSTRRGSSEQLGLPSSEPHPWSKKLDKSSSELHPSSKKLGPPSSELHSPSKKLRPPSSELHPSSKKLGQSSSELHPPSKKLLPSSSELHLSSSKRHPWGAKLRPPSSELEIFEQKVPMAEFEPPRVDHKARRASLQAPMTEQKASWCCCKKQHAQSKKPRGWRLERRARGLKGRERGVKCCGRGSGRQRRLSGTLTAT